HYGKHGVVDGFFIKIENKWGAINPYGKLTTEVKYDNVSLVKDYMAHIEGNEIRSQLEQGKKPDKYTSMGRFADGFVSVGVNGKYGFINANGREITPLKYDYIEPISEGTALVAIVIPTTSANREYAIRIVDELYVPHHTGVRYRPNSPVKKINRKYGFIDKNGQEIVPLKYDEAMSFSEGMAKVRVQDKWGFVDQTGREVISPKYESVGSFSDGLARIYDYPKYIYIDKSGREVIQ